MLQLLAPLLLVLVLLLLLPLSLPLALLPLLLPLLLSLLLPLLLPLQLLLPLALQLGSRSARAHVKEVHIRVQERGVVIAGQAQRAEGLGMLLPVPAWDNT